MQEGNAVLSGDGVGEEVGEEFGAGGFADAGVALEVRDAEGGHEGVCVVAADVGADEGELDAPEDGHG